MDSATLMRLAFVVLGLSRTQVLVSTIELVTMTGSLLYFLDGGRPFSLLPGITLAVTWLAETRLGYVESVERYDEYDGKVAWFLLGGGDDLLYRQDKVLKFVFSLIELFKKYMVYFYRELLYPVPVLLHPVRVLLHPVQ